MNDEHIGTGEAMAGKELFVAQFSDLNEGDRKLIPFGETEIGVYRLKGKLYAYENRCAHQGGPACEGLTMPLVENVIAEDRTYQKMRFNYDEWHIVCPWHAWEYDVTTGRCVADPKFRLKKYELIEKADGIYVRVA
jgi:nitrite reductase (NADH) small subunit